MITTVDGIVNALGNNSSRIVIDKSSIANAIAGGVHSLWRATGFPAQASIPTTAVLCTKSITGAIGFQNQIAPADSYLAYAFASSSNNATTIEMHDRLVQMGGLNLTLLTAQSVVMDLATLLVPTDRLGEANYSEVQWWLEVYADGGATASNATINVTYDDLSTGNLAVVSVGGTLRASRMIPLLSAINGRFIKAINFVTLSSSTGTAGNFGFTATRIRANLPLPLANKSEIFDWANLGFPEIANDSCLFFVATPTTTSTGTLRGGGKIAHG